jgi:hypothetical protein
MGFASSFAKASSYAKATEDRTEDWSLYPAYALKFLLFFLLLTAY